jgi:hypothetical protein
MCGEASTLNPKSRHSVLALATSTDSVTGCPNSASRVQRINRQQPGAPRYRWFGVPRSQSSDGNRFKFAARKPGLWIYTSPARFGGNRSATCSVEQGH